jgi:Uma2 family endonuclease
MTTAVKKISAEQVLRLGLQNAELIDGEIEEYMAAGGLHGETTVNIASILRAWTVAPKTGKIGVESGFLIRRDPDRVRVPNVWFIRQERIEGGQSPTGFWNTAPDLAVEVLSDSDTVRTIHGKMLDYFAIGTLLVWLVYPEDQVVEVCTPDGRRQTLQGSDRLEGFAQLPGFSCAVGGVFS